MLRGPSEEVYFTAFFPPLRAEPLLALPPRWPTGDVTDLVARTRHAFARPCRGSRGHADVRAEPDHADERSLSGPRAEG